MEYVNLLGVRIHRVSLEQMLRIFSVTINSCDKIVISNVNIHALNIAYETPWFKEFLNQSYLTFCDGVGVKLAAWISGQKLEYRFTPPDFFDTICELALQNRWKIFFLGAKPGIAEAAAEKLRNKYHNLQVAVHHGFFDKTINSIENDFVIEKIAQFQPQILVLGFGMPLQEKWIKENYENLNTNILFPAGAIFDYLSGKLTRAPRLMTDHGFEWLGRLLVEPGRLWKRYLIGNPLFFWRIFVHDILKFALPD